MHVERYDIRARIGAGAMGTVYEAYDPDLDRLVALKILKTDASLGTAGEELRQRLLREARAMARLSHPNVVAVYDVGTFGHQLFIAMELVRGTTLGGWLSKRPRTVREILGRVRARRRGARGGARCRARSPRLQAGQRARRRRRPRARHRLRPRPRVRRGVGRPRAGGLAAAHRLGGLGQADAVGCRRRHACVHVARAVRRGARRTRARTSSRSRVALYESLYGLRPFDGATVMELMKNTRAGRVSEAPRGTRVPAAVRRALLRGLGVSREQRPASMRAMLEEPRTRGAGARAWTLGVAPGGALLAACVAAVSSCGRTRGASRGRTGGGPSSRCSTFVPGRATARRGRVARRRGRAEPSRPRWRGRESARDCRPTTSRGRGVAGSTDGKEPIPPPLRARETLSARGSRHRHVRVEGDLRRATRSRSNAHVVDASTGKTISQARQKGTLAGSRDLSLAVADDLGEGLGLRELSGEERADGARGVAFESRRQCTSTPTRSTTRGPSTLGARGSSRRQSRSSRSSDASCGARACAHRARLQRPRAARGAGRARTLGELARADRLSNEALVHELASEWDKAAEISARCSRSSPMTSSTACGS